MHTELVLAITVLNNPYICNHAGLFHFYLIFGLSNSPKRYIYVRSIN